MTEHGLSGTAGEHFPPDTFAVTLDHLEQMTRRLGIFLIVVCLLVPVVSLVYAAATEQSWWKLFKAEGNLTSWWSSMQLLVIGVLAWLNFRLRCLMEQAEVLPSAALGGIWLVFALGFIFLGLDESFDFHEFLRAELFRANDLFTRSRYIIRGDVGLYLFFLVGLAFVPFLLGELKSHRPTFNLFFTALVLTLPLLVIDSLQDRVMRQWWNWRFWDYFFEEQGEIVVQLLFALAFLALLRQRLGLWRQAVAATGKE